MNVTLVLTHDCNLACTYCYTGEKFRRAMDAATAQRGVDLAFSGRGPVDLGFFGGEPLIRFDQLVEIARDARARAAREGRVLRLSVTTNGTLLTPARARTLRELDVEVTLSLDGTREAHDATRPQRGGRSSFDDVLGGARAMADAGLPLRVIAVVAPGNVRHLGESVRFIIGLGARYLSLNPCFEQTWSDEDLAAWESGMREAAEAYAAELRAGRVVAMPTFDNKLLAAAKGGLSGCDTCAVGDGEVAVAPSGNLYPCARLVGEDRDTRWVVGHLDTGVDAAAVRSIARGPADPACDACAERWRCGASCVCANLAETGNPALPGGAQCWYEQASARIADEVGRRLLDERCETFIAWTYGRVARAADEWAAASRAPASQGPVAIESVVPAARRVRLPVLRGAA